MSSSFCQGSLKEPAVLGGWDTCSSMAPLRTQVEVQSPHQCLRTTNMLTKHSTQAQEMWIVETIISSPGKHHQEWGDGKTVGCRWAAGTSRKTSIRLHVLESKELRPRASKPQKVPRYESRVLMKNWELGVQWTTGYKRQERTGGSQPPCTLGRDAASRKTPHNQD